MPIMGITRSRKDMISSRSFWPSCAEGQPMKKTVKAALKIARESRNKKPVDKSADMRLWMKLADIQEALRPKE